MQDKQVDPYLANHIANITLVEEKLNKREIGAKPPSVYIEEFKQQNPNLAGALSTHFISLTGFGLENDDYDRFFERRLKLISRALQKKLR